MQSNKMKILTRQHKWVDVTFNPNKGYVEDTEGTVYCETDMLAVENDVRSKYVRCMNCGKYVLNTPTALQAHRDLSTTSDACLTCHRLSMANTQRIKSTYTKQEDGTYVVTDKTKCKLICRNGGYGNSVDINSEQARSRCIYVGCRTADMAPFTSIFMNYPGVLDELATVDALDPSVWTYDHKYGNMHCFRATSRYKVRAYVYPTGIIGYFIYTTRNSDYKFLYSKKYQKIIWELSDQYRDNHHNISANVKTQLARLVADVYNKEN